MTLVKKVECPELNGKRMRSGFWDRRPEALLLKKFELYAVKQILVILRFVFQTHSEDLVIEEEI